MTPKSHHDIDDLFYCWTCGAQDDDYDAFVGEVAVLCFMEPLDSRFAQHAGFQVKCGTCAVGELSYDGAPVRQRHVSVRVNGKLLRIAFSA